ncbi:MAG: tRNA (adenosine(37)-N6)-dimethylallyltransferase MiaA [Pseudomonadota bacterium]
MASPYQVVAVCGPTAVGKSALSIDLALSSNAEVVNIDSVQVYQGLDIGSAKLTLEQRRGVPHHLLDIFPPDRAGNVGDFREQALRAIADIKGRGRLPLLVGGSGLYVTAVLRGLAELPSTPDHVRREVAELSPEQQYAELMRVDPVSAARLNPNDSQRVSRAVEVARITGRPASELVDRHAFSSTDVVALVIVLCRPREELYERIDRRAREMLDGGLIEETAGLLARYGRIPILETLGYKQASDYLDGVLALEGVATEISMHTRRFAKRQMTYWRNEPAKRGWLVRPGADEQAVELGGAEEGSRRAKADSKGFRAFELDSPGALREMVERRLKRPLERSEVWYIRG